MSYGRDREKYEIERIMLDVEKRGKGRVVFIEGELGTGKTLLLNEIADMCRSRGYITMMGGCIHADAADPFLPYIDAIKSAKDSLPDIFYNEAKRIESNRSIEAIAGFILDLSRVNKVFIGIDNAHNAHPTALHLLTYLAMHAVERPLLIVATYSPEEIYEGDEIVHSLSDAIRTISREKNMTHIQIKRLNYEDCKKMMQDFFETSDIPLAVEKTIISKSEGNPYFLLEICKMLEDSGVYQRDKKKFIEGFSEDDVPLPDEITGMILSRLAGIEDEVMKVLEYAAVYGNKMNEEVLQQALGLDDEEFAECIEKLINHHILLEIHHDKYHYTFAHALMRDAIYERMSRARKKLIHGKIGHAIEKKYMGRIEDVVYDLAHHFKNSRDIKKALQYLVQAGIISEKMGAYKEALNYYEESLTILEWMEETRVNLEKKRDILEALGRANHYTANLTTAMEYMEAAGELSRKLKDDARLIDEYLEMTKMCEKLAKWNDAERWASEALEVATEIDSPSHILACYRELGYISARRGELGKSEDYYRKGKDEIPRVGKTKDVAELYVSMGNLLLDMHRINDAERYYNMAMEYFREKEDKYNIPRILNNLAVLERRRKNIDKSLELYRDAIDYSIKVGNKIVLAYATSGASESYALKGDFEKAEAFIKDAMKLTAEIGDEYLSAINVFRKGIIYQCLGKHNEALRLFNESISLLSKHGAHATLNRIRIEAAKSAMRAGDMNTGRRLLQEAKEWYKSIGAEEVVKEINADLDRSGDMSEGDE